MKPDTFVVVKNNLGTPQVRVFSDRLAALNYADFWYKITCGDLEQMGHEIKEKEFIKDLGDGVIKTEIGDIEFDLIETKRDLPPR